MGGAHPQSFLGSPVMATPRELEDSIRRINEIIVDLMLFRPVMTKIPTPDSRLRRIIQAVRPPVRRDDEWDRRSAEELPG
jgi:hypothetical protein